MAKKDYIFFNKKGNPLNFKWDEENNIWTGSLHFPEVSIGLFESETIYVLEKVIDSSANILYGHPRKTPGVNEESNIDILLDDEEDTAFKFFTVDNPYIEQPIVSVTKNPLSRLYASDAADSIDIVSGLTLTDSNVPAVMRIDICIQDMDGGEFTNYLRMSDDQGDILYIELYGETIPEDERLPILLSNIGESISHVDEYIFRTSDINEDLPNYEILNQKRKEFLIEAHNIKPYLSAYKGIINMLYFFGYFDLTLKEYWYDPYTKEFHFEDIKLYENEKLSDPNNNMHQYKKTSLFGLFYDINRVVDGEYDDLGLPVTEDVFAYSNEEVLIKLFGLKEYFRSHNIGGTAEIIDIVGEVSFYNKFSFNFWIDNSEEFVIDQHIQPEFDAEVIGDEDDGVIASYATNQISSYIRDVRDITIDFSNCPLDRVMDSTDKFYHPCFVGYFAPFYMDDPEFLDQPEIDVGMAVKLTNRTFDKTWSELGMFWSDANNSEILATWKTITHMNHYEMEWIVEKVTTDDDKRIWRWNERGGILDLREIDVILPYDGYYNVTIVIYGYGNVNSKFTKKSYLKAELKNADLAAFFRYIDKDLQKWSSNYLTWGQINSEWKNPIYDNDEFKMSENEVQEQTFHISNYEFVDNLGIQDATVESPTWADLFNVAWKDYDYVRWQDIVPERERLAQFIINKIKAKGTLQIGEDTYVLPDTLNINEFEKLESLLESQIGKDISNFYYTTRVRNNKKYLDCVSKDEGVIGDRYIGASGGINLVSDKTFSTWSEAGKTKWGSVPIKWVNSEKIAYAKSHENQFSWDNTKMYRTRFDIPTMISVYLSIDNSKMAGKTSVKWTITDETREYNVLEDIESLYFVYMFRQEGTYSIKAEITDSNGNVNSVTKKNMIKVYKTDRFRLLRKINKEK